MGRELWRGMGESVTCGLGTCDLVMRRLEDACNGGLVDWGTCGLGPGCPQAHGLKSTRPRVHTSQISQLPVVHTSPGPHIPGSTSLRVQTSVSPYVSKSTSSLTPYRPLVYIVPKSTCFRVQLPTSQGYFSVPLLITAQRTG